MSNHIRVFISYAHGSKTDGHDKRVLALSNELRKDGFATEIDRYHSAPPEGWPKWMDHQIARADYILVICNESYWNRATQDSKEGEGLGVRWENTLTFQYIYEAGTENHRFIPVLFSADDQKFIPIPLRGATRYLVQYPDRGDPGYNDLCDALNGKHPAERPPLGDPTEHRAVSRADRDDVTSVENLIARSREGSQLLLSWPKSLANDIVIPRAELDTLLAQIQDNPCSTTLLLGTKGSGKSALLALLGQHLIEQQIALLAIKADTIPNSISDADKLSEFLGLPISAEDAVLRISISRPVVLLVDQLDAIAELADRKSERLNLLLNLISALTGVNNVHVISSCREFEYRHDVRLNTLDAKPLYLSLPNWEVIEPILQNSGYETTTFAESTRELLRTPWHLKLFLEIADPADCPTSFYGLLDKLWQLHVVPHSERIALLEKLAGRMNDDEQLWLPSSIVDEDIHASNALESNGILIRSENGTTIGFRHQTFHDYTLARSFTRGTTSLSTHVLERQDGLYIRPTLWSGLSLLRETDRVRYRAELQKLIDARPRKHIETLIHEFIGSQLEPDPIEVSILLPLIASEDNGRQVLAAMNGSAGWFEQLQDNESFLRWLQSPSERAMFCVPLLISALQFAPDRVIQLLTQHWLNCPKYDHFFVSILWRLPKWDASKVELACKIARRSQGDRVGLLAEYISQDCPTLAPCLIRAEIEGIMDRGTDKQSTVESIFNDDQRWYLLDRIAEDEPAAYLKELWTWFLDAMNCLRTPNSNILEAYVDDSVSFLSFSDRTERMNPIIRSFLTAAQSLAREDPIVFLDFFQPHYKSNLLVVHQILSISFREIVEAHPDRVADYLLGDRRRLQIGTLHNSHKFTAQLIAAVSPHLSSKQLSQLEEQIRSFTVYGPGVMEESDAETRRLRQRWDREHRLRLLRSIPDDVISPSSGELKQSEERSFPNLPEKERESWGGLIGPRMTLDEMRQASDQHLLNLFDSLPHNSAWDNPNHRRLPPGRAGGSNQQSRILMELAKSDPKRVIGLMTKLNPKEHEIYAGAAIEGLAASEIPTDEITELILQCNARDFRSEEFRNGASFAVKSRANADNPIDLEVLESMYQWLEDTDDPPWPDKHEHQMDEQDTKHRSILFGHTAGQLMTLTSGRGAIMRALIAGCLDRKAPEVDRVLRYMRDRIRHERHPKIWAESLYFMSSLFWEQTDLAEQIFDEVISSCPSVLEHYWAVLAIARHIGWRISEECSQRLLRVIAQSSNAFSQQAYGELLVLCHARSEREWTTDLINQLTCGDPSASAFRGATFAAKVVFKEVICRSITTDVLCRAAESDDSNLHQIIGGALWVDEDERLILDHDARRLLDALRLNPAALKHAVEYLPATLAPFAAIEPELVVGICQDILDVAGTELNDISGTVWEAAQSLTSIALTVHRQAQHRELGLQLFERLISCDVREARAALDLLDRRTPRSIATQFRKRRNRKKARNLKAWVAT